MESFPKDVLFTLALELDLPSMLKWCETNPRINEKVCNNQDVWKRKLLKDYQDYQRFELNKAPNQIYNFMYQLSLVKELLKTDETLYDIYLKKSIDLRNKRLKKIPTLDLPNLQSLYLDNNLLTSLPEFHLPNLQYLSLDNNKLKSIPKFNLPNLRYLHLNDNELTSIPEISMPNLRDFFLYNNKLTNLPTFNLPNLESLYLNKNKLTNLPEFDLPKLQYLDLRNNPFTSLPEFNLPKLQHFQLDYSLGGSVKAELKKKYRNKVVFETD